MKVLGGGWLVLLTSLSRAAAAVEPVELVPAPVPGGDVRDFAFDTNQPGVVYAAVVGPGLYKSTDGGANFARAGLPQDRPYVPRALLVSKTTPGLVFVCEQHESGSSDVVVAVWRSEDAGETFTPVVSAPGGGCTTLAESNTPGTFFAATWQESDSTGQLDVVLHESTDAGVTWNPNTIAWTEPPQLDDVGITSLVELPNGRMLAGFTNAFNQFQLSHDGLFAYSDDGVTFTVATDDESTTPVDATVFDIVVAPGGRTLAFVDEFPIDRALRTTSDGASWSTLSFDDRNFDPSLCAELDYVAAGDTFVTLSHNVLTRGTFAAGAGSLEDGKALPSVLEHEYPLADHCTFAVDPSQPTAVLVGDEAGGEGVLRLPGGSERFESTRGVNAARLNFAAYDAGSGYQLAASADGRVYFADTGARSFRELYRGRGTDTESITAVAFDRTDPKRLVVALLVTVDDSTFPVVKAPRLKELADATLTEPDAPPFAHTAWVDAPDPAEFEGTERIQTLFIDGMDRWIGLRMNDQNRYGEYLYRSRDGGQSYAPVPLRVERGVSLITTDPRDPNVFYVGAGDGSSDPAEPGTKGLFRSSDRGESFEQIGRDTEIGTSEVTDIAFDPSDPQKYWVISSGPLGQLYRTTDGGVTFTRQSSAEVGGFTAVTYAESAQTLLALGLTGFFALESSGRWTQLFALPGIGRALYPGVYGVATSAGLYVSEDLLGTPWPGAGGGSGGAQSAGGAPPQAGSENGTGGSQGGAAARGGASGSGPIISAGTQGSATGGSGGSGNSSHGLGGGDTETDNGCGCRLVRIDSASFPSAFGLALLLGLAASRRARRASK